MKKLIFLFLIFFSATTYAQSKWTATWATAPLFTTNDNMPKTQLNDCSMRQIVRVSIGGESIRLHISNDYGDAPLQIKSVFIATPTDSCDINPKTTRYLTFGNKRYVSIDAGKTIVSDLVKYKLTPLQQLSITINYVSSPKKLTSHPGSRTTSYIIKGVAKPQTSFASGERVNHWYNISAIDVMAENAKCIAVLGNSITDGYGCTVNKNNRWTDQLAESLVSKGKAKGVLNLGIGGNNVLSYGLGDPALKRFDRDIMAQQGVTTLVIFEGINDIGGINGNAEKITAELIEAYKVFIAKAKAQGWKVYGATITPFKKHYYFNYFHEAARQSVNEWIRKCKDFDGVLDFDALLRDPQNQSTFNEVYKNDYLHPNVEGYKKMGIYAADILCGE